MDHPMDNKDTLTMLPAVPSFTKRSIAARPKSRAARWVYAPIRNPARRDSLQMCHWVRESEKGQLFLVFCLV